MQQIIEFLAGLGAWNWLIAALIFFLLEAMLPGVLFVWFGVAAFGVGVLTLFVAMPWQLQLVVFSVFAVVSVFMMRRFFEARESGEDQLILNSRGAQHIGRKVTVVEDISNGRGRVVLADTTWIAEGPEIAAGQSAEIVGVNGTALVVKPLT